MQVSSTQTILIKLEVYFDIKYPPLRKGNLKTHKSDRGQGSTQIIARYYNSDGQRASKIINNDYHEHEAVS